MGWIKIRCSRNEEIVSKEDDNAAQKIPRSPLFAMLSKIREMQLPSEKDNMHTTGKFLFSI